MTVLFDIGRVLLDFHFEESMASLIPADLPEREARLQLVMDRKDAFETGAIDPDAYIAWALATLSSTAGPGEFRHAWRNIFTPNDPMWQCARRLADAGHRLILFSNTNAIHCPWMFEQYPEFSLFHGSVLSYEAGSIKPSPAIYQYAIDKFSLIPENTLYIDDLAQNISTGRQFGFRCHQYELSRHAAFEAWLAQELR